MITKSVVSLLVILYFLVVATVRTYKSWERNPRSYKSAVVLLAILPQMLVPIVAPASHASANVAFVVTFLLLAYALRIRVDDPTPRRGPA